MSDSKCSNSDDGEHLYAAGTTGAIEVAPGVMRYRYIETCVHCGKVKEL